MPIKIVKTITKKERSSDSSVENQLLIVKNSGIAAYMTPKAATPLFQQNLKQCYRAVRATPLLEEPLSSKPFSIHYS